LRCDIVFVVGRKTKTNSHFVVEEKCGHRGIDKLKTHTAISLLEAQIKQVSFYCARGFNPEKLYYDDGANVTGTKFMLQEQRLILKHWPPGQHESIVDANTRVLNAYIRSVIVCLPYQMPEALISHLAVDAYCIHETRCATKSRAWRHPTCSWKE